MTAPTRWWAPPIGKVELDGVDRAMLAVSGENARLDLGGALLAAHRVGAGACAQAAATPLLDERGLVSALAAARSNLGTPMADAVSKCVEKGSYGALLTRDFLDDADEAALVVFKSALAHGVPAAAAATRAGAVYGVPARDLGTYLALANDPKTTAAVLVDKADRTLFGYVEKVCGEEAGRDEVSKATLMAEPPRGGVGVAEREYVRDEIGRFATVGAAGPGVVARLRQRLGVGAGAVPRVSDTRPSEQVSTETKTGPTAREVLAARQVLAARAKAKRDQRLARQVSAQPQTETEVPAPVAAPERTRSVRTRSSRVATYSPKMLARLEAEEPSPRPPETAVPPQAPPARPGTGLNKRFRSSAAGGDYVSVPGTVQLAVGGEAGRVFLRKELKAEPGEIFRWGHLLARANNQRPIFSHEEPIDSEEGPLALREAIATVGRPHPKYTHGDLVTQASMDRRIPQLKGQTKKQQEWEIQEHLASIGEGGNIDREADIQFVPAEGQGDAWYLVDDHGAPENEQPFVYVFDVPKMDALGINHGDEERPSWSVDPDQQFRVVPDAPRPTWDPRGFFVKHIYLEPVSEEDWDKANGRAERLAQRDAGLNPKGDKSAALSVAERSELVRTEPRDETGRWVPKGVVERLRERQKIAQDKQRRAQAVAEVRNARAVRRAQRQSRRVVAVPAEAIATQEEPVAMQDAVARLRSARSRATRSATPRLSSWLHSPERAKAVAATEAVTRPLPALPKSAPPEPHVHRPVKRELVISPENMHVAMDAADFRQMVGTSMVGADVIEIDPMDVEHFAKERVPAGAEAALRRKIKYSFDPTVMGDLTTNKVAFSPAKDVLAGVAEHINSLLRISGVSNVLAVRETARDQAENDPVTWTFLYQQDARPPDPVYLIRFPEYYEPTDDAIRLKRMAGTSYLTDESEFNIKSGGGLIRHIPVVTYEVVAPYDPSGDDEIPRER